MPGRVAQLVGESSCTPKGCRFDSQSGHLREATGQFLSHIGDSICLSVCLSPKSIIKYPRVRIFLKIQDNSANWKDTRWKHGQPPFRQKPFPRTQLQTVLRVGNRVTARKSHKQDLQVPTCLLTFYPEFQNSAMHFTRGKYCFLRLRVPLSRKAKATSGAFEYASSYGWESSVRDLGREGGLGHEPGITVPAPVWTGPGACGKPSGDLPGEAGLWTEVPRLGTFATPSTQRRVGISSSGRLWTEVMIWERSLWPPTGTSFSLVHTCSRGLLENESRGSPGCPRTCSPRRALGVSTVLALLGSGAKCSLLFSIYFPILKFLKEQR